MIIACPACATRYVVPDSAIGPEGRTVRCAKCKHSWFQDGPELVEPIAAAYAAPPAQGPPSPSPSAGPPREERAPPVQPAMAEEAAREPTPAFPSPPMGSEDAADAAGAADDAPVESAGVAGEAQQPADQYDDDGFSRPIPAPAPVSVPEGPADTAEEALPEPANWRGDRPAASFADDDEASPFDHGPPFRPRRNWLRWFTWGAAGFAVLALAALAGMSILGTPSWLPIDKPLFGADPGLTVEFPASEQERRTLPNGAEFFGARVVVKNETRETKRVPPLLIVLRDARERVVYSWELVPPQRTLAPGEAQTINEAMTDVPKSAVYADIGWAPR